MADRAAAERAAVREVREEVGVVPTAWRRLRTITDPNASDADPVVYHMYAVDAWEGGEPVALGDEHSELGWFSPRTAANFPDLALDEYRQVFREALGLRPP